MDYLKNSNTAVYWYPVFAVMIGTGLRVGEVTGLRWCDIDLEDGIIDVNHTLIYYDHRTSEGKKGCYFNVNTPKTEAGKRQVPMLEFVKEAFVMEKQRQELLGIHCEATIDGYTDFIFLKPHTHLVGNHPLRNIFTKMRLWVFTPYCMQKCSIHLVGNHPYIYSVVPSITHSKRQEFLYEIRVRARFVKNRPKVKEQRK